MPRGKLKYKVELVSMRQDIFSDGTYGKRQTEPIAKPKIVETTSMKNARLLARRYAMEHDVFQRAAEGHRIRWRGDWKSSSQKYTYITTCSHYRYFIFVKLHSKRREADYESLAARERKGNP